MNLLPYLLILLAWPTTSIVVGYVRNQIRQRQPDRGTRWIAIVGLLMQGTLMALGIMLLIDKP